MSCNGCRVLRKGCSETCPLRSCLQWIESAESQRHATLFLAKFFGRTDLMSFIASVPQTRRPALFQSLLFEGCGRTVNPVNGAVGLLCSGNWHLCEAAVETVLAGGVLRAQPDAVAGASTGIRRPFRPLRLEHDAREMNENSSSLMNRAEEQETVRYGGHKKNQILNLFM
ncbi:LOB domain-containing protein 39-like isoform X1 [Vigna umbellata]|uniref:LOB domain-containing protein 39-like isoform X1 n=1 Tax=Vigna umbellata TaxID=87088 RepID=UPI001F5F0DC4|nr:LOB domain-containing protein 39-like isoform X1 [Vigna umbellata]